MTDAVLSEHERREIYRVADDARALLAMPGWDDVAKNVEGRLRVLRDALESGLDREDYLETVGWIRGLREVLDVPRKAISLAAEMKEIEDAT